MSIRIGTSGWSYDHWQGVLYPVGLAPRRRLAALRGGIRHGRGERELLPLASASTFATWRERLPAGFTMSVKAPRGLTHGKRLYDPRPGSRG